MSSASVCTILCLAMVAPLTVSFNFRSKCYTTHKSNMYNPICDGNKNIEKDLFLNEQDTRGIDKLDLRNFNSVIFGSNVLIQKINITNVYYVTLSLNNWNLKEVTLNGVSDLKLRYPGRRGYSLLNMIVKDVKKLRFIGEDIVWKLKSIKLTNVEDVDLKFKKLAIYATNFSIELSKIRVEGELTLKAAVVNIKNNTQLHFLNKGYLNVTANEFTVEGSEIDLEDGLISIDSNKAIFSHNSFYQFNKDSVFTVGHTNVKFIGNFFSTENMFDILLSNVEHVEYVNSQFDCKYCSLRVTTDLGELGVVNYCYSTCNLILNHYKQLLENNYFCKTGETTVTDTILCNANSSELYHGEDETVTDMDFLQWFLLFLIPLILVIALLCCICHRDNRKKLKELALVNILPRELECERRQMSIPRDLNNESYYEEIGPPYTCK